MHLITKIRYTLSPSTPGMPSTPSPDTTIHGSRVRVAFLGVAVALPPSESQGINLLPPYWALIVYQMARYEGGCEKKTPDRHQQGIKKIASRTELQLQRFSVQVLLEGERGFRPS